MYVKNGRKAVIDDLEKHNLRQLSINNLQARIAELEADFGRLQAVRFDSVAVQGYKTSLEERLVNIIAEKDDLKERLKRTKNKRKRVEKALYALTESERKILEKFYIERASADERMALCEEFGVERSELYRQKDEALARLDFILYGEDPA